MLGNVGVPYRTEGAQDGRSTETPGLSHRPKIHPRLRACPCGATSRFQVVLKVSFLNGDLKCVYHMRIPQRAATEVHTSPALFQSLCSVTQLCPTLCDPMDCSPPGSFCPWGFSRQEYWSGLPCPPPGDLPNPGIEPRSPAFQADSLPSESPGRKMCSLHISPSWFFSLR